MSFNNVVEGFTRGDPLAPLQIWAIWDLPDESTFPDDASDENPYMWDVTQGAWVTIDNITEPN